ncbi:MAG: hypothetical protein AABX72_05235 [Nanoarchaeota archaeon]
MAGGGVGVGAASPHPAPQEGSLDVFRVSCMLHAPADVSQLMLYRLQSIQLVAPKHPAKHDAVVGVGSNDAQAAAPQAGLPPNPQSTVAEPAGQTPS